MKIIKRILIAVLVVVALAGGAFVYLAQSSKNGSAPGLVDGALSPCPDAPNCVSSEAGTAAEKLVEPFALDAWDALAGSIESMGGVITVREDGYLAAEFTSETMGFVDDLELRKGDDAVHLRSASRVGYSDAGVNAQRVAELRATLNE